MMNVIFYLLISYLIGTFMTGYIVIRFLYHEDIREKGSGNVGAKNAGRVYGKRAAVLTFLGDFIKGAIIIVIARYFSFSETMQLVGLLFVITGHVFPIFLRWKGGKGIATFLGGITLLNPLLLVPLILVFGILYVWKRNFTLAGLSAIGILPISFYFVNNQMVNTMLFAVIALFVLIVHKRGKKL
ncbi:glycerol-3-phosphate acyltransferase [Cytobacillus sp. FJAT-54145]|uniref:Glycerol-3-phosphate acyltransferase n=1 Tax=Cytobacillus spartinae TaxID=3299023 RepID=A0ABW6KFB6_9BACI